MKTNLCELALKGNEEVPQGTGQYVMLDAEDMHVQHACYLGLAAIGAGRITTFVFQPGDDYDYPENYAEALENHIDTFIQDLTKELNYIASGDDTIEVERRCYCPLPFEDVEHRLHCNTAMNLLSLIIHLNDSHELSVEQINSTLELLGKC